MREQGSASIITAWVRRGMRHPMTITQASTDDAGDCSLRSSFVPDKVYSLLLPDNPPNIQR
jgi:hypothetical protein